MFLLYNLLLTLLSPIWLPWLLWRAGRRKEKPNWGERLGRYTLPLRGDRRRIWVHTVSVGEFVAVRPVLREIRRCLPDHEIVVSVTTSSAHQTARESAPGTYDHLVYFPIDIARFQLAAMNRVRPDVVVVFETELWMNFLWAAKAMRARTLLINGRISDKHFPSSRRIRFYYQALFRFLDRALMRTDGDADRIQQLGAHHVEVLGNCKFDQAVEGTGADASDLARELGVSGVKRVIVVGSTRGQAEETLVLDALLDLSFDEIQVIHAPRHLERAQDLARQVQERTGSVALRSKGETGPYLILDTYGELAGSYALADVVIVGGGFEDLGGQNIFQPLAHGKAVIHGPNMQNFQDVADLALACGATRIAATSSDLSLLVRQLLDDPSLRKRMGDAATQLVKRNLGAAGRYASAIKDESKSAGSPSN